MSALEKGLKVNPNKVTSNMQTSANKIVQKHLKTLGVYDGAIDGIIGLKSAAAIRRVLSSNADEIAGYINWTPKRRAIALFQLLCKDKSIEVGTIDGLWGPQTEFAYDSMVELSETSFSPVPWRDEVPVDANPNGWPRQHEADLISFFGQPGEQPLAKVTCPWTLKIAWDLNSTTNTITCHEKVSGSLERVLNNVFNHYGQAEIERLGLNLYGGCNNYRKKRGGTSWSNHAWAIALDWDPSSNRYKWGRDRARMAHPDYDAWWGFWEEEGWLSLGRAKNFDWMHIQAAKL